MAPKMGALGSHRQVAVNTWRMSIARSSIPPAETAALHSAEDGARHILRLYRKLARRSGDVLRRQCFCEPFEEPGWTPEDFDRGMAQAIAHEWIEHEGAWYALTGAGFRAYQLLPSGGPARPVSEFSPAPPPPRATPQPAGAGPAPSFGRRL